MKLYPCAKINLGLNVTEKRPDGYHNLETVFLPIGVCDELEVETSDVDDVPHAGRPRRRFQRLRIHH